MTTAPLPPVPPPGPPSVPQDAPLVVAIDGPAGSGKSTVAKRLAAALGWAHLDSGAMYRAVTHRAMALRIALSDAKALADLAARAEVALDPDGGRVGIDAEDVTVAIRRPEIDAGVSVVAAHGPLREVMRRHQRGFAARFRRIVAEGRDMGTRVFPDAVVKVFLDATVAERARRRAGDLAARGSVTEEGAVRAAIEERDHLDQSREEDPLRPAEGAVVVDTTAATPDQVVARILALVRSRVPPSEAT